MAISQQMLEKMGWERRFRPPESIIIEVRNKLAKVKRQLGVTKPQYVSQQTGISEMAAVRLLSYKSLSFDEACSVQEWLKNV